MTWLSLVAMWSSGFIFGAWCARRYPPLGYDGTAADD